MIGIDAGWHATQMVKVKPVRDGSTVPLVHRAVSACKTTINRGNPVSLFATQSPLPNPAGSQVPVVLFDVFKRRLAAVMTDDESLGMTGYRAIPRVGVLRNGGDLPASAEAHPRWVRRFDNSVNRKAVSALAAVVIPSNPLAARADVTIKRLMWQVLSAFTAILGDRLRTRHLDLLSGRGVVIGAGLFQQSRPYSLPELYSLSRARAWRPNNTVGFTPLGGG